MKRDNTKRTELDVAVLRHHLDYDPETGNFTWRDGLVKHGRPGGYRKCKPGSIAGSITPDGYRVIGLQGRRWMAHNLAWAYVHGEVPNCDIDHINRNPSDNRIANLRAVTRAQNMRNSEKWLRRGEATGTRLTRSGWAAQISFHGRTRHLGFFEDQSQARAAYIAFVREHNLEAGQ